MRKYSEKIIYNSIDLFVKISTKFLKNDINIQLMINFADKFLFSVFKLINKVRIFLFNFFIFKIYFIDIGNKKRKN